jgi:hypothetical protein
MELPIKQYEVYYPKGFIQGEKGRIISQDSQVVVLAIHPDGNVVVCRFGDYRDSIITHTNNLSKWKVK